jgi:hypothetical protein
LRLYHRVFGLLPLLSLFVAVEAVGEITQLRLWNRTTGSGLVVGQCEAGAATPHVERLLAVIKSVDAVVAQYADSIELRHDGNGT